MPDFNYHALPVQQSRSRHLGPAIVTAVCQPDIEVAVNGRRLLAILAVPGIYTPVTGDTVLLIEEGDAAYIIGVLNATGPMTINAPGELRLIAPHGNITMNATAITSNAVDISLNAETMSITAGRMSERFKSLRQVIADSFDLDVGELRARVVETFSLFARRVRATAEEDVKIDGKHIHLG